MDRIRNHQTEKPNSETGELELDNALSLATTFIRRHKPEFAEMNITKLGAGLDNQAFVVSDLVVRIAKDNSIEHEIELLSKLAPELPIAIPRPLYVDHELGAFAYRLLEGTPLLNKNAPVSSAPIISNFLTHLHTAELRVFEGIITTQSINPADWLEDLKSSPEVLIEYLKQDIPRASETNTLCHADLGSEHILTLEGRITGIIDWTDASITDPAIDFARLYRDFGESFLNEILQNYGGPSIAFQRIEFFARCAALEDLEYGSTRNLAQYTESATKALERLFPTHLLDSVRL